MKKIYYCNPLSIPSAKNLRSFADPDLIFFEDRFYMFVSGAQVFISKDLISWEYYHLEFPVKVIAPAITFFQGSFYLSGNGGIGLWKAKHPLGPWNYSGDIVDQSGNKVFWADLMFFVENGKFYCYHNSGKGIGTDGIFVTELDPSFDLLRPKKETKLCFAYNPEHIWERWGEFNEHPDIAWIEAPYMLKYNNRYYLQYSACGTEWKSYAVGVYSSDSPEGPFIYQKNSPVLRDKKGLLNGTGHHAIIKDIEGKIWCIYHVLFHNRDKWDRRLAIDPVKFEEDGSLVIDGPTDIPRNFYNPEEILGIPLSVNKEVKVSSFSDGYFPQYAVDNNVRTFWKAKDSSLPQWIEIDLLSSFYINSVRIIFAEFMTESKISEGSWIFSISVSNDKRSYKKILSEVETSSDIFFTDFLPVKSRWVFLEIYKTPEIPAGLCEFTVFGRQDNKMLNF